MRARCSRAASRAPAPELALLLLLLLLCSSRLASSAILPISWQPRAFLYRGFLSAAECAVLRAAAEPRLQPSAAGGDEAAAAAAAVRGLTRGAFFERDETPLLAAVGARAASWTQVPAAHHEPVQVVHYGGGEGYASHVDFFDGAALRADPHGGAQRVATVLLFLSTPAAGGEVVFPGALPMPSPDSGAAANPAPLLAAQPLSDCAAAAVAAGGAAVQPVAGDALLFWSQELVGGADERAAHASCAAPAGDKWVATLWMRAREWKPAA